jgi:FkbM family methyltransferase
MILIEGLWWPDDTRDSQTRHALKHVRSLEFAISRCRQRRTVVQAGGNVGLWPRRLAQSFRRVITFEPDAVSLECLRRNVPAVVESVDAALGAQPGIISLQRESLGSHHISHEGASVQQVTLDSYAFTDVDLLQLDVEGYELQALLGAAETLDRCRPIVQIELRDFGARYGASDDAVRGLLSTFGYQQVSAQPGNDFVFEVA